MPPPPPPLAGRLLMSGTLKVFSSRWIFITSVQSVDPDLPVFPGLRALKLSEAFDRWKTAGFANNCRIFYT